MYVGLFFILLKFIASHDNAICVQCLITSFMFFFDGDGCFFLYWGPAATDCSRENIFVSEIRICLASITYSNTSCEWVSQAVIEQVLGQEIVQLFTHTITQGLSNYSYGILEYCQIVPFLSKQCLTWYWKVPSFQLENCLQRFIDRKLGQNSSQVSVLLSNRFILRPIFWG